MASTHNFYTLPGGDEIDLRKVEEVEHEYGGRFGIIMTSGHSESIDVEDVARADFLTLWKAAD